MTIPEVTTARLRLRGHAVADLDAVAALWGDPAVVRFIGGVPASRGDAWMRLQRYVGHWALLGHGFWVIEERASGAFVGEVGIAEFERGLVPPLGAPECGWVLAPAMHGRGYATEAVTAALAWFDATIGAPRVVCMIDPDNAPSLAVARKCGFVRYADTHYKGDAAVLLARTAPR